MKNQEVSICGKACCECGFTKDGTTDTLYSDFLDILKSGMIFPCHMYLKDKTGSENTGIEKLDEIKVCRGYVAFMKKHMKIPNHPIWEEMSKELNQDDLDNLLDLDELINRHKGLRENIRLNNN